MNIKEELLSQLETKISTEIYNHDFDHEALSYLKIDTEIDTYNHNLQIVLELRLENINRSIYVNDIIIHEITVYDEDDNTIDLDITGDSVGEYLDSWY